VCKIPQTKGYITVGQWLTHSTEKSGYITVGWGKNKYSKPGEIIK
jgi:hypothetical protein